MTTAVQDRAALEAERRRLSIAAHGGDPAARERVKAIATELAQLDAEAELGKLAGEEQRRLAREEADRQKAARVASLRQQRDELLGQRTEAYRAVERATAALVDAIGTARTVGRELGKSAIALGEPGIDFHVTDLALADHIRGALPAALDAPVLMIGVPCPLTRAAA